VITAAVVPRKGMNVTVEDLAAYAKEHLASYKRPKRLHLVEDLPKNLYGKVMRKELKKEFQKK